MRNRLEHWFWDQIACLVVRYGRLQRLTWATWITWGPLWLYAGENQAALGYRQYRLYIF